MFVYVCACVRVLVCIFPCSRVNPRPFHCSAQHKAQFVLKGRNKSDVLTDYVKYVEYVLKQAAEEVTEIDRFEAPYYDYLQSPLQPLMDNLEASTYEVFERDPVKYQRYEDAITAALEKTDEEKVSIVMVVSCTCHVLMCAVCTVLCCHAGGCGQRAARQACACCS